MILSKYSLRYKGTRISFRRFLFLRCDACGKTFLSSHNITTKLRNDYHFCCFSCSRVGMKKGNVLDLKRQETSLERYGTKHPMQNEETKKKREDTCMELYGFKQASSSPETKQKTIATNLERYGAENPMQNEEIANKNLETWVSKTDDEKQQIKEKRKQTSLERFGTEHPNQSDEIRTKISKSSLGKKMSLETRRKMAEQKRGIKGEDHPLFGVSRPDMRGSNNINWNGGISSLYKKIRRTSQYFMWRSTCFERDNWTCTECGKTNCELHVDHIVPFAVIIAENEIKEVWEAFKVEELWDITNGRTLCVECHRNTDTYGGSTKKFLADNRK